MYLYSLGLPEDVPQFDLLFQSRPLSPQNPRVSLALYHSAQLRLFGVRLPRSLDPRPRAPVVRPTGARAGLGVTGLWQFQGIHNGHQDWRLCSRTSGLQLEE